MSAKASSGVDSAIALRDGRFLTWSWDKTARLWTSDGTELKILGKAMPFPAEMVGRYAIQWFGALELKDGRILTWGLDHAARIWRLDDEYLIAWADQAIEDLDPLVVKTQCESFLLSLEVCALVGEDVYRTDVVAALLAQGEALAELNDPRSAAALALAVTESATKSGEERTAVKQKVRQIRAEHAL